MKWGSYRKEGNEDYESVIKITPRIKYDSDMTEPQDTEDGLTLTASKVCKETATERNGMKGLLMKTVGA